MESIGPPEDAPHLSALELFIFGILGLLFVVDIQRLNPLSAQVWRYPRWDINPFLFSEPLQFFHLAGYAALAGAFGTILHEIFVTGRLGQNSRIEFVIGSGLLAGVYACTFIFRRKMEVRT